MPWLYLLLAILFEVAATSNLKLAQGFTRLLPSLAVVVGYALAFYFLGLSLKAIPLSVAYAIWAGLGTALVAPVGILFFAEALTLPKLLGLLLVVAGVVLLNLSANAHGP